MPMAKAPDGPNFLLLIEAMKACGSKEELAKLFQAIATPDELADLTARFAIAAGLLHNTPVKGSQRLVERVGGTIAEGGYKSAFHNLASVTLVYPKGRASSWANGLLDRLGFNTRLDSKTPELYYAQEPSLSPAKQVCFVRQRGGAALKHLVSPHANEIRPDFILGLGSDVLAETLAEALATNQAEAAAAVSSLWILAPKELALTARNVPLAFYRLTPNDATPADLVVTSYPYLWSKLCTEDERQIEVACEEGGTELTTRRLIDTGKSAIAFEMVDSGSSAENADLVWDDRRPMAVVMPLVVTHHGPDAEGVAGNLRAHLAASTGQEWEPASEVFNIMIAACARPDAPGSRIASALLASVSNAA